MCALALAEVLVPRREGDARLAPFVDPRVPRVDHRNQDKLVGERAGHVRVPQVFTPEESKVPQQHVEQALGIARQVVEGNLERGGINLRT